MTLQGCLEGEMRVFKPWHLVSSVSVVSMLLEKKIHRNGKNITVRCGTGIHIKYDELTTSLHIHGNKSHMAQGYSVCLLLTLFLVSEPLLPRDESFFLLLDGPCFRLSFISHLCFNHLNHQDFLCSSSCLGASFTENMI